MKWLDNIKRIYNDGTVGICPFCKSSETEYIFVEHENGHGYLNICCNSCKEQVHIDCKSIPDNRNCMSLDTALELSREKSA